MGKDFENKKLILEEQEILDDIVDGMEIVLDKLDEKAEKYVKEGKEAREAGMHENYYAFLLAKKGLKDTKENRDIFQEARDELYDTRVELYIDDDNYKTVLQIGDHTFYDNDSGRQFVIGWNLPICRPLWGGMTPENYEFDRYNDKGEFKAHVKCKLAMRRNIELRFTKVMNVISAFPLTKEEQDELIIDALTQELLQRRSDNEWKSIIKSIQEKQKEIVLSPLNHNLIVQGCAGSGKTMIMLHRLPILLMDNPQVLQKNNLYVITPSKTYIQLAQDMTRKLEIADLKMGVMNDYYDYCISKYNSPEHAYGEIDPSIKLSEIQEKYIYSKELQREIDGFYQEFYESHFINLDKEFDLYQIKKAVPSSNTIAAIIQADILNQQHVLSANEDELKVYFKQIQNLIRQFRGLATVLLQSQNTIDRSIRKKISSELEKIENAKKDLEKLDKIRNEIAWNNRLVIIDDANYRMKNLIKIQGEISADGEYFDSFIPIIKVINNLLDLVSEVDENYEKNSHEIIYRLLDNKEELLLRCDLALSSIYYFEFKYSEHAEPIDDRVDLIENLKRVIVQNDTKCLSLKRFLQIENVSSSFSCNNTDTVKKAYSNVMKKIGIEPNNKGVLVATSSSPYIYLQALYRFNGVPNGAKESLITIDEAQGVSVEEIRLIKNLNGNKLILNLYGDVKQHIEGTKGIDDWNDLLQIMKFTLYTMNDNYRNASQITDFCNSSFADMRMRAMNTVGKGVHKLQNVDHFVTAMENQFTDVNRTGLSAIIVKNKYEAEYIKDCFNNFTEKMSDMTSGRFDVHRTRWNILTVDLSKGLEFGTVVVVSGNMTENEKYIAYTRALDELFVFDTIVDTTKYVPSKQVEIAVTGKENKKSELSPKTRVMKKDSSSVTFDISKKSKVKTYFLSCGLEVIDNRDKKGHLWVIGEKKDIEAYVNHAVDEFSISGMYSAGKESKFKYGWCTKTKK